MIVQPIQILIKKSLHNTKMKLVSIKPATDGKHKYTALFTDPKKTTHFGAAGYDDFLKTKDVNKREAYLARHKARENWSDPTTAGALSRYLLWGSSSSLKQNITEFKKKFNL
jgi:hypothetical protein